MIIEKELTTSKSLIEDINMYACFPGKFVYLENEHHSIQLADAIDNGETTDSPRIFILTDFLNDRIRVIGGGMSYLLSMKNLQIISTHLLRREEGYSEYWYTKITEREKLIFVEMEGEILIVDKNLEVVKVFQKYFNDYVVELSEDKITLDCDGEQKLIPL